MNDQFLSGKRVILLEDDFYLASDAAELLRSSGAIVRGPYGNPEDARQALEAGDVDVGVIDINLGFGPNFDVPARLTQAGIPFIFATGYGRDAVPDDYAHIHRLTKPYRPDRLLACLRDVLNPAELSVLSRPVADGVDAGRSH